MITDQTPFIRTEELVIFESENPRAIINLVAPEVKRAMLECPSEYLEMEDKRLQAQFPNQMPTHTDLRIRTAFWLEYSRSMDTGTRMRSTAIYGGVCSKNYFLHRFLHDPFRVAFMLRKPVEYMVAMEEALTLGIERLREILELPMIDEKGRPDPKTAAVILKAVEMIDMRCRGAIIQRVEQKSVNVNLNQNETKSTTSTTIEVSTHSLDEIDQKLRELEIKAGEVKLALPKDVVVQAIRLEEKEETPDASS